MMRTGLSFRLRESLEARRVPLDLLGRNGAREDADFADLAVEQASAAMPVAHP
jgi:hypothetical protein